MFKNENVFWLLSNFSYFNTPFGKHILVKPNDNRNNSVRRAHWKIWKFNAFDQYDFSLSQLMFSPWFGHEVSWCLAHDLGMKSADVKLVISTWSQLMLSYDLTLQLQFNFGSTIANI